MPSGQRIPRDQVDQLLYNFVLSPIEARLFKAWLAAHKDDFESYLFNIRVGKGLDPGPTYPESARRQAILNSQKRIDVVGYRGDHPTILEIKDRGGTTALGELLVYADLYALSFPLEPGPSLRLITNSLQPDMEGSFRSRGVKIDLVGLPAGG